MADEMKEKGMMGKDKMGGGMMDSGMMKSNMMDDSESGAYEGGRMDAGMSEEARSDSKPTEAEMYKDRSTSMGEYKEANMSYMQGMYGETEVSEDNYDAMLNKTVHEFLVPRMKGYEENNMKIKAMMASEPHLAQIIADMSKGAKFEEVLPRYVDIENLTLMPGDPDYTQWEANNKMRMDNHKMSMDRKTQLENNQMKSQDVMMSWFDEKKMDDSGKKEFGMFVSDLLDRAYAGEITPEFLNKMYYAMNYEGDMAMAEDMGRTRGRNEKIVDAKMMDDKMMKGDGLPVVAGGAAKMADEKPDNSNSFEKGLGKMVTKKPIIPGNGY